MAMRSATSGVMAALLLCGCTAEYPTGEPANAEDRDVRVWVDDRTGCEYLVYASRLGAGVTPRLRRNGKPDCPDVNMEGI